MAATARAGARMGGHVASCSGCRARRPVAEFMRVSRCVDLRGCAWWRVLRRACFWLTGEDFRRPRDQRVDVGEFGCEASSSAAIGSGAKN